eukprot:s1678_g1.t1
MARKRRLCCGCGYVPTVTIAVLAFGLVAVAANLYVLHPRGVRGKLSCSCMIWIYCLPFLGIALADCRGHCPQKGHGIRLLQQHQRLGRNGMHSLENAQEVSLHSSSLQVLSEPVELPTLHSEVSGDGSLAFVRFEHRGRLHRYNLSSFNVYSKDALALAHTAQGAEPLMTLPRGFRSRVPGAWATAWLQRGTVSGIFEDDKGRIMRIAIAEHSRIHQLQLLVINASEALVKKEHSPDGGELEKVSDSGWIIPDRTGLPLEEAMASLDPATWGCYSGDANLHDFVIGTVADVEAWRKHGDDLQTGGDRDTGRAWEGCWPNKVSRTSDGQGHTAEHALSGHAGYVAHAAVDAGAGDINGPHAAATAVVHASHDDAGAGQESHDATGFHGLGRAYNAPSDGYNDWTARQQAEGDHHGGCRNQPGRASAKGRPVEKAAPKKGGDPPDDDDDYEYESSYEYEGDEDPAEEETVTNDPSVGVTPRSAHREEPEERAGRARQGARRAPEEGAPAEDAHPRKMDCPLPFEQNRLRRGPRPSIRSRYQPSSKLLEETQRMRRCYLSCGNSRQKLSDAKRRWAVQAARQSRPILAKIFQNPSGRNGWKSLGGRCMKTPWTSRPSDASDVPRGLQEECPHAFKDLKWGANGSAQWADCRRCKLRKCLYYSVTHGALMEGAEPNLEGLIILDTGCRTAVAGRAWHDAFMAKLYALNLEWFSVEHEEVFRFGAGKPVLCTEAGLSDPTWNEQVMAAPGSGGIPHRQPSAGLPCIGRAIRAGALECQDGLPSAEDFCVRWQLAGVEVVPYEAWNFECCARPRSPRSGVERQGTGRAEAAPHLRSIQHGAVAGSTPNSGVHATTGPIYGVHGRAVK